MTTHHKAGICGVWAILLLVPAAAFGATALIDFNTGFGQPDENCTPPAPRPPLFNYPDYAGQTEPYIVEPDTYCTGDPLRLNGSPGRYGNMSHLTEFYPEGSLVSANNEIRFSWENPASDDHWARIITFPLNRVFPVLTAPTLDVAVGSSIQMDIALVGVLPDETESFGGQLEFSLGLRESGLLVPLGTDGHDSAAPLELAGITCKGRDPVNGGACPGGSVTDLNVPVGGVTLTENGSGPVWHTVKWEFVDDGGVTKVDVYVNNVLTGDNLNIVGFAAGGDGVLCGPGDPCETNKRVSLDSMMIRKPVNDDVTKKWFVLFDNIIIDAPTVIADTVLIKEPVSQLHTRVTVRYIDTAAEEVRLFLDPVSTPEADPTLIATAVPGIDVDFSDREHTFTGLTLATGDKLHAQQVVATVEGPLSSEVVVQALYCFETFDESIAKAVSPGGAGNFTTWYDVNNVTFATAANDTLDGDAAMIIDDSGFMNGIYRIYQSAIPQTGRYRATARVHITEDPDNPNAIQEYEMGVVVNGTHRTVGSCHNESLNAVDPTQPGQAIAAYSGLDSGDNSAQLTQEIHTGPFDAVENDNLLVVLSTNVDTAWSEVTKLCGEDGICGTTSPTVCDDILDTLDTCETVACRSPQQNAQGTWNVRPNRTNTSGTWGNPAAVRVDEICLLPAPPCADVPTPGILTPVYSESVQVTVTGVSASATAVAVYADGVKVGEITAGIVAGNNVIGVAAPLPVTTLLVATQTIGGQESCLDAPPIVVIDICNSIASVRPSVPLIVGDTVVNVTGVKTSAPAATMVAVYDMGTDGSSETLIGTAPANGTGTVPVFLTTALLVDRQIVATQTVSGIESCKLGAAPRTVGNCDQVPVVTLQVPLNQGATSVTVTGVDPLATLVKIYRKDANNVMIGQQYGNGTDTVVVDVPPLVNGWLLKATQVLRSREQCVPTDANGEMVGTGGNSPVRLSIGIREVPSLVGPAGANGGTGSASIEWLIPNDAADPLDARIVGNADVGRTPWGKLVSPSNDWQTVTFARGSASVIKPFTGDGFLTGTWRVLEHLAVAQNETNVGPYTMYLDTAESNPNGGAPIFETFEGYPLNAEVIFRAPRSASTTQGHLSNAPNASANDHTRNDSAQTGTASQRLEWRYKDWATAIIEGSSPEETTLYRWARITTLNTLYLPNPQINVGTTQAYTLRLRVLLPLPPEICNDGIDNDGDTLIDCADSDCTGYSGCSSNRTIIAWRSVRTHSVSGRLGLTLDPAATGNGLTGPTVESRTGGIRLIEVEFDGPVTLANTAAVTVNGGAIPPTSVTLSTPDTLAIAFNAGVLPDQGCYAVTIGAGAIAQTLLGDNTCSVRGVIGDVTGDGVTTLSDVIYAKMKLSSPAFANARFDVNMAGDVINTADLGAIKGQVASPAHQASCP